MDASESLGVWYNFFSLWWNQAKQRGIFWQSLWVPSSPDQFINLKIHLQSEMSV